jgi:hypothetical protein
MRRKLWLSKPDLGLGGGVAADAIEGSLSRLDRGSGQGGPQGRSSKTKCRCHCVGYGDCLEAGIAGKKSFGGKNKSSEHGLLMMVLSTAGPRYVNRFPLS